MAIDINKFGPVTVDPKPDYKYHELCTAWPQASDEDLDKMIDMAKKLGGIINDPTILWKDPNVKDGELLILDGRNRQIVCKTLNMPMEYREFLGNYEEARTYAIMRNMARRHLTVSQKAVQYALIAQVDERNGYGKGPEIRKIAELAKTSLATARDAITIVNEGNEDAIQRILDGKSNPKKEVDNLIKGAKKIDIKGFFIPKNLKPIDQSEPMYQDGMGEVVPKRIEDCWKRLEDFSRLREMVEYFIPELKRIIDHQSGKGVSLDYIRHLKDLMRDLDGRRPHYVCPHCHGKLRCQCERCAARWLARGSDSPMCYACQGNGFLMKEEPYPDKEWCIAFPAIV